MNKEEAIHEFEQLVKFKLSMLRLTRSMGNNNYEEQKENVLQCYDYIKEKLNE